MYALQCIAQTGSNQSHKWGAYMAYLSREVEFNILLDRWQVISETSLSNRTSNNQEKICLKN